MDMSLLISMNIPESPIPFLYFYKKKDVPVLSQVSVLAGANVFLLSPGQHLPFTRGLLQSESSIRRPGTWSRRCLCCFSDPTVAAALLMSGASLVLPD